MTVVLVCTFKKRNSSQSVKILKWASEAFIYENTIQYIKWTDITLIICV